MIHAQCTAPPQRLYSLPEVSAEIVPLNRPASCPLVFPRGIPPRIEKPVTKRETGDDLISIIFKN